MPVPLIVIATLTALNIMFGSLLETNKKPADVAPIIKVETSEETEKRIKQERIDAMNRRLRIRKEALGEIE